MPFVSNWFCEIQQRDAININTGDTSSLLLRVNSCKKPSAAIYKNKSDYLLAFMDAIYYLKVFCKEGSQLGLQQMPEETNDHKMDNIQPLLAILVHSLLFE